jgi:hypothetical protein
MAAPHKLVLFVEGEGDRDAVLVKRILTAQQLWQGLSLDPQPFVVGELGKLVRNEASDWIRFLKAAAKSRRPLGGVLLLVDGDMDRLRGKPFCACEVARYLAGRAREAGGGVLFSVAVVAALREFESWLLAGVESLAGNLLTGGRPGVRAGTTSPSGDLEKAPRDAKGWLRKYMASGYKPTTDQRALTELVALDMIRQRNLRSFRRLESAVTQLAGAIGSGNHVSTPTGP